METDVERIVLDIKAHREKEITASVNHVAFGRSDGLFNNEERTFWIVLKQSAGDDVLPGTGKDYPVSRDAPLGAILIQNYKGEHTYNVPERFRDKVYKNTIKIYDRAKYVPSYDESVIAADIVINISEDENTYLYRNLSELINQITSINKKISKTQEGLEKIEKEQKETQNILTKAREEQKETYEILLTAAEQKKEAAAILRGQLEKEKHEQQAFITNAQNFIRQNAELRWQPILDPTQDAVKRKKIFDGGTLIINGGPGTGKTTSLIQRIKFLTSNTIEQYKGLDVKQKEILYNQNTGWVFFSPNKLLALFLKNSMAKENLIASDDTVKVWSKQKEEIIRLYGWVDEQKRVFKFCKDQPEGVLFPDQNRVLDIIKDFEKYYFERQIKKIKKITDKDVINIVNFEDLLKEYVRSIIKRIEMKSGDTNKEINDDAIFNRVLSILLNDLPKAYKIYRENQYKNRNKYWNLEFLDKLIKNKKSPLIHQEEQSLLIYISNRYCQNVYHNFSSYWQQLKHPCVLTYIKHCRPVVAIDEATDFSVLDLLAMHSLKHPEFSSVTLSGDLMQRMTVNGIKNWQDFSGLVDSVLIENLKISYRQSPTLLSMAQEIYQYSANKKAEYISYMEHSHLEPKPLIKISNETTEKVKWISDRIREIDIIYRQSVGSLPSVAVFVPKEEDIAGFVGDLEAQLEGDIPVLGCPKGLVLGDSSDVRVYAIDKIKGLEFEAVFFHNLDNLEISQNDLLLKYLYVGLSRATFYLGITLSKELDIGLRFIEKHFVHNGNWQLKDKSSAAENKGA
jgi:hypothetical protein